MDRYLLNTISYGKDVRFITFHLVHNQNENCHHDHIPFNLKGNGILFFSVYLERLESLGIMGTQLRSLFKSLDTIVLL